MAKFVQTEFFKCLNSIFLKKDLIKFFFEQIKEYTDIHTHIHIYVECILRLQTTQNDGF